MHQASVHVRLRHEGGHPPLELCLVDLDVLVVLAPPKHRLEVPDEKLLV